MKSKALFTAVLAAVMATSLTTPAWAESPTYQMTTDIPLSITTPDSGENLHRCAGVLRWCPHQEHR